MLPQIYSTVSWKRISNTKYQFSELAWNMTMTPGNICAGFKNVASTCPFNPEAINTKQGEERSTEILTYVSQECLDNGVDITVDEPTYVDMRDIATNSSKKVDVTPEQIHL